MMRLVWPLGLLFFSIPFVFGGLEAVALAYLGFAMVILLGGVFEALLPGPAPLGFRSPRPWADLWLDLIAYAKMQLVSPSLAAVDDLWQSVLLRTLWIPDRRLRWLLRELVFAVWVPFVALDSLRVFVAGIFTASFGAIARWRSDDDTKDE